MTLSWNRILSGLLAVGYIIGAFVAAGAAGGFVVLAIVILPLAWIWFGEPMGGFTGPSGSIWITAPSPGLMVCIAGWVLLIVSLFVILL